MNRPSILMSLVASALAVCAWGGVAFFIQVIHAREVATAKAIADARQEHVSEESRGQMVSVFESTAAGRQYLTDILNVDLLALADRVTAVGADAGVALRVSNATPENKPLTKKGAAASALSVVHLTIDAEGSFEKLFNALALLESLPIPSKIEEVNFTRADDTSDTPWSMKVRMRVLTALPINS